MSTPPSTTLTLADAQKLLRGFICTERMPAEVVANKPLIRQALHLVAEASDYQIFGICADRLSDGMNALQTYLKALGYDAAPTVDHRQDAVYIKFNPYTGRCHCDRYTGAHRGVLVSCQASDPDSINETFGHLPLDLFEDSSLSTFS